MINSFRKSMQLNNKGNIVRSTLPKANQFQPLPSHLLIFPINLSQLHIYWILWKTIYMHFWAFEGAPISFNSNCFLIIIIDPSVSLKVFVHLKLTRFIICCTNILLDTCNGDMRYLNILMLVDILS